MRKISESQCKISAHPIPELVVFLPEISVNQNTIPNDFLGNNNQSRHRENI